MRRRAHALAVLAAVTILVGRLAQRSTTPARSGSPIRTPSARPVVHLDVTAREPDDPRLQRLAHDAASRILAANPDAEEVRRTVWHEIGHHLGMGEEQLDEWESLSQHEQTVLIFTALFHDAGKPQTSRLDPDTGRIQSPKHAIKGEHFARHVLRELDGDIPTREAITQLVRYHGRPDQQLQP